ncbi:hypothetical protein [Pseudomonas lactis]|uniref:hypothetical protein n=1 Tax=Pseudomonas lactis TaxID=1615674 RepID=UPI001EE36847|nr:MULTISPECIES: hypothetical protein [Pseudomonas]
MELLLGIKLRARQIYSAWQSCADKAQAAVLAELNEGVRGFHKPNPNRGQVRWQGGQEKLIDFLYKTSFMNIYC